MRAYLVIIPLFLFFTITVAPKTDFYGWQDLYCWLFYLSFPYVLKLVFYAFDTYAPTIGIDIPKMTGEIKYPSMINKLILRLIFLLFSRLSYSPLPWYWFPLIFIFRDAVYYLNHRIMHDYPKLCHFHSFHHVNKTHLRKEHATHFDPNGIDYIITSISLHSWRIIPMSSMQHFVMNLVSGIHAAFGHESSVSYWIDLHTHIIHHKFIKRNYGLHLFWDYLFGTLKLD